MIPFPIGCPIRDKRYLDSAIENNELLDGLNDGFFLGIEMIMFLKQLHRVQEHQWGVACRLVR
jgi:ATP:ADP antiporter, AAA family